VRDGDLEVARVPAKVLTEAPTYVREGVKPAWLTELQGYDLSQIPDVGAGAYNGSERTLMTSDILLELLASPEIASKRLVWRQYDHQVGTNTVGMLKADMPDLVMINLGIDPTTSGPDEWQEAANWLQMQKDSGTVRQYYDQGYIDDFVAGNTPVTMAWSGDVLYYKFWAGYTDFEWVFPDDGALQWQDNMMIPVGSANPVGALELMDWVYKPDIAVGITEYVLYLSPVKGVQDLILKDADAAEADGSKGLAKKLRATASSPYLFPDESVLSRASFGTSITTDDQAEEWDNIFLPISQS
jgi:spermidine/putrescine-binding protein